MTAVVKLDYDNQQSQIPVDQFWAPQYNGMGGSPAQYSEPLIPGLRAENGDQFTKPRRWDFWKWLIVIQGFCIIGLAIALIVLAVTHNHPDDYSTPYAPGSLIRSVPAGGFIEPSKVAPSHSFRFSISSVYARYPTEGGYIKELRADSLKHAQCCCTYKITGKTIRETETCSDLGSKRNSLLHFTVQKDDGQTHDDAGSFVIVNTGKDLLGARCSLTWS